MKWKVLPQKSADLIEQLLINRHIKTAKDRKQFFNPKISDFEKDLQISGIKKSQLRIKKAIKNNEQIVIFGDYDVDGICALAILYKSLTFLGAKVLPYIPHREKEGYGLSKLGLDFAKENNASVVITVDNGIVAFEQAKYAKSLGLDLIITDHHVLGSKLPEAYEIVHSVKMCGAAVAWCLIRDLTAKEMAFDLLQFVAIATICDLIPLTGLGRAFASEGLKILNKSTNLGLNALIEQAGIDGVIHAFEVSYILGPRLNAIGRIEHAMDALRLLCTKDPAKAERLAQLLCQANSQRQQLTSLALEQAKAMITEQQKIHVLSSKEWPLGIIGLVAGKITDEYFRPAVAISLGETVAKGSARSIDGVNIVEVIRKQADILIDVGGHPGAAGFSLLSKQVAAFKKRLEDDLKDLPDMEKVLEIDAEIKLTALNKQLIWELTKFEPFGFKNPKPIMVLYQVKIADIKTVGLGKHLKFKVTDPKQNCRMEAIDAIAFGMGQQETLLTNGQLIDLAFTAELDHYNGFEKIQIKVKDIVVK